MNGVLKVEFGDELKKIRESRGMTVNQLAMYSEVSSATISRVENKKRGIPRPKYIRKLAEALKYPYVDLMKLAGYSDSDESRETSIEETEADAKRKKGKDILDEIKEERLDNTLFLLEQLKKE